MSHGFDQECSTCGEYFETTLKQKQHARERNHTELAYCLSPRTSGPRCRHHCSREKFHPGACGVDTSHGKIFWDSPLQKMIRRVLEKAQTVSEKQPLIAEWMVARAAYKFAVKLGYPADSDDWVIVSTLDHFRGVVENLRRYK